LNESNQTMPKLTLLAFRKSIACTVLIGSNVYLFENHALAQITPDNTLGSESSIVNPNNNINGLDSDLIDGGAIRGTNLFHSFQEFNVGEARGAYFTNPTGIQSIFSRVTGVNASQIFGKIGVMGDASLFLVNPNGIVFGSNATLDVKGSFLGTTASSINFANGAQFTTNSTPTPSLLTISVPIGLQFGAEPQSITAFGNGQGIRKTTDLIDTSSGLRVQPNQTLALVGGDLLLSGATIKTAGGQVTLGSVDSFSLVNLIPTTTGWNLDYGSINNFQDISLINTTVVDVSGEGSGNVQIYGKTLTLQNGSQIEASTLGSRSGGTFNINTTDSVSLIGGSDDPNNSSGLTAQVYPGATGNGSNLTIETNQLNILDGAQIITGTFDAGSAGNLIVRATDAVILAGILPSNNFVNSGIFTSVLPGATGNSGDLTIETKTLTMTDGGQIFTGTLGGGSAGNLTVKATESITLMGTSPLSNRFGSALATSVNPGATGNGGNLTIETNQLNIIDGALVSSSSFGSGKAGNLRIQADSIILNGTSTDGKSPSRVTTRTNGSNDAGNLTIESNHLTIGNGATITASSTGTGNAGNLNISSDSIQLTNKSSIVTESNSGQGGNINLQAQNLFLRGNSRISATAGNRGDGGNIIINTNTLVGLENSNITARAFEGNGGNIQISTQGLFLSPDSIISANSERGVNGVVDTQILGFDVTNSITPLNNNFVTPEQVVAGSCLARRNSQQGSFVVTGSGGLPINPYSNIESWDNSTQGQSQSNNLTPLEKPSPVNNAQAEVTPKKWQPGDPIVEAQTLIITADGRGLLRTAQQARLADPKSLICSTEQADLPKD